jgi:hypothetical protein
MLKSWPLTLTNNMLFFLIMVHVIKCTKLYDPEAWDSVSILPTRFSIKWCYNLWPLTLKSNKVLPLIMVIQCTKLYDTEAYGLVSILQSFNTKWCYDFDLDKQQVDCSHHGNQVYQVVRSWNLWFSFYSAYNI